MAKASALFAEAARLRDLARTLPHGEAVLEIQLLIDELERRAREHGNGDGKEARMLGRRPRLSNLTNEQLLVRARAYRSMGESASEEQTRESLNRIASTLELMVNVRQERAMT